jgi:hypothetical protein
MASGKATSSSRELRAFVQLIDILLSVPRNKILAELQRGKGAKTSVPGKISLAGAFSGNARRKDA